MKSLKMTAWLFCIAMIFSTQTLWAQAFEVEFDTTSYLQVEPFHRSCQVWATITNTGSQVELIRIDAWVVPSQGWSFHSPYYLYLQPGESERPLALTVQHSGGSEQITVDFHIFAISNTSSSVDLSIDVTRVGIHSPGPSDTFPIRIQVYDENTGEPLPDANVYVWAGSRPEQAYTTRAGLFELRVAPYDTLNALAQEYNVPWGGYSLEVHCEGYQSVYEDSLAPLQDATEISLDVYLSRLDKTADFQSSWYCPLEHPGVWSVVPSEDWSHLAVGMGKHPDPWDVHPCSTEVHLFNLTGMALWSYPVGEEVWGIDMRADASLVAAGTCDGSLNVIDETGRSVWKHASHPGNEIREVRFSHDGKYLCYETSPFKLFDANTGDTLWEFPFLDLRWRGISFSHDDAYIACGGGESLLLLDINGNFVWERYIGGIVTYYIGFTPELSKIVVADKGDLLSCFDGSGNLLWRHFIDVLTDAHMSGDGSRVVALSHDGIVRMYDGSGRILWRRAVEGAGHNAIHMTDDGKYIVVGGGTTNRPYKTMLLDENGNLLWEHSEPGPIPHPYHPYLISAMCVAVSQDASCIVSGYGAGNPGIQLFQGQITTSVREEGSNITRSSCTYRMSQNFPNPFNSATKIDYSLRKDDHVLLEIYNILGQRVATLLNEKQHAGRHLLQWDASGFASGIYLYRLRSGEFTKTRKMMLLK